MKRGKRCYYCANIRSRGAGMKRTDGGENFKTVCDKTGKPTSPSAKGCAEFAPDRSKPKKEKPQAAKQGARDNEKYIIKSPLVREVCRGLGGWRFAPRDEAEEKLFAGCLAKICAAAKEYARDLIIAAANKIGLED